MELKKRSEYPIGGLKTIDGKGRMLDGSQEMEPKGGSKYSMGVVKEVVEKRRITDGSYERNQREMKSAQREF